jgi:spore germination protein YaaH
VRDVPPDELDAKLKLLVDDEHRTVIIGTADGLEGMTDEQISALLHRVRDLRARYQASGYVVTVSTDEYRRRRS